MLDQLNAFDIRVFQAINLGFPSAFADFLMRVLSSSVPWSLLAVGFLVYGFYKRARTVLLTCAIAAVAIGATDWVTYRLLKPHFERIRPCYQRIEYRLAQDGCGSDFGFPSNHAANGAAVVAVLTWRFRRSGFLASAPAVLAVGVSRIYLGAHFPGDVLFGYVVGGSIGTGVAAAAWRLVDAKISKPVQTVS